MKTVMSKLQRLWRIDANGSVESELTIKHILYNHMPHGSGFDSGVKLVSLSPEKVVFEAPFHHMNDHGMYDGWVTYIVNVRSTFTGNEVKVSVKGYDNTARKYADDLHRMYIAETFYYNLFDKDIGE